MDDVEHTSTEKMVPNSERGEDGMIRTKVMSCIHKVFTWRMMKPILAGQFLSLLICGTSITSNYLVQEKVEVPVFQNLVNYLLFAFVYCTILAVKRTGEGEVLLFKILKDSCWKYMFIALVDVEANYMIVKAYQYTSLTSVQLLDCFTIVVVMCLSCYFLRVRYNAVHFIGLVISLVGVVCMVVADILHDEQTHAYPNPLLGDFLVLGASVCYGMSNVTMEYVSKKQRQGFLHILGMLGLFGSVIAGVQTIILEREALASIDWSWKIVGLMAGYSTCMFVLYTCMPLVMLLSSATAVNISILTADLFALFVGHFLFSQAISPLYLVSFATIVVALVIYNSKPPTQLEQQGEGVEEEVAHADDGKCSSFSAGVECGSAL